MSATTTLEPLFQTDYRQTPKPKVLCVIPARGGSKGFPDKNIADLMGKPLLAHTIRHALESKIVTEVYVSTDDEEIASVARKYGAKVVIRPPELSGDYSPSEWAVRHVMNNIDWKPQFVVMLQCTSPIRRSRDIDFAFDTILESGADSLFSGVAAPRFIWQGTQGDMYPVNYDYRARPMRQVGALGYAENGSIYITKRHILEETGNRLGGRIAMYKMGYWSQFEVDQVDDLDLCEWIMERENL
jgi:N-acylneuraminate cytidylyltransferase